MELHVYISKDVDNEEEARQAYNAIRRDLAGQEGLTIKATFFVNKDLSDTPEVP